ncbi:unnamed protein product [Closterium sp. NIES-54]
MLALLRTSRRAGVGCWVGVGSVSVTRVGDDEELAIGAGAVVASADADVDVAAVVCWIVANALVRSAKVMVCDYQKPPELKSESRPGGCDQVVKLTITSLSAVP